MQIKFPISASGAMLLAVLGPPSIAQPGAAGASQSGAGVSLPEMDPGAYEETSRIVAVRGNAPAELKRAMRSKTAGTNAFCYMAEEVAGQRISIVEARSGKECRPVEATSTGAITTIRLACADADTSGTLVHVGAFQRDMASFRSTVSVDFLKQKRKMAYTAEVTWRRVGDQCNTIE